MITFAQASCHVIDIPDMNFEIIQEAHEIPIRTSKYLLNNLFFGFDILFTSL